MNLCFRGQAQIAHQLGIPRNHVDRVDPAVTDGNALQRDRFRGSSAQLSVVLKHFRAEGGHVVAGIALPRDVKTACLGLGEDLVELHHQRHQVSGNAIPAVGAIPRASAGEGETGSDGVVDEKHAVLAIPRRVAGVRLQLRIQLHGAHLDEAAEGRIAARAALQPDEQGGVHRAGLRRKIPKEHLLLPIVVRVKESAVRLNLEVREHHNTFLLGGLGTLPRQHLGQEQRLTHICRRCGLPEKAEASSLRSEDASLRQAQRARSHDRKTLQHGRLWKSALPNNRARMGLEKSAVKPRHVARA
mmetsp:Transcript_35569/g.101211  ORF Transcript_35569/g.101211 Transcript_35569/m.101211 type:complete len:301 (+) Transcript_35569:761-1663(+)